MTALMVEQRDILLKSRVTEQQLFEVAARPYLAVLIDQASQAWLHKLMTAAELARSNETLL